MRLHNAVFSTSFGLAPAVAIGIAAPAMLYPAQAVASNGCTIQGPSRLREFPITDVPPVPGRPYCADQHLPDPCGDTTCYRRVLRFACWF